MHSQIIETRDTQNLSYILPTDDLLFQTGYKVLQSQEDNGFISCARIIYNGKIKLVYDVSKYKALDVLLPGLNPVSFLIIIKNLIDAIIEVKNNGFMQCENIETSFEKVFVDGNSYKVFLIYLPIDLPMSPDGYITFESKLKKNVLLATEANDHLKSCEVLALCEKMSDAINSIEMIRDFVSQNFQQAGTLAGGQKTVEDTRKELESKAERTVLEDSAEGKSVGSSAVQHRAHKQKKPLFSRLKKKKQRPPKQNVIPSFKMEGGSTEILDDIYVPRLVLTGVKTPVKIEIEINKEVFVIGKNADSVDGSVTFNNAISRIHCKVEYEKGKHYISDLGSANGTYVNGARIGANQRMPIRPGDKIRLANSDFVLKEL